MTHQMGNRIRTELDDLASPVELSEVKARASKYANPRRRSIGSAVVAFGILLTIVAVGLTMAQHSNQRHRVVAGVDSTGSKVNHTYHLRFPSGVQVGGSTTTDSAVWVAYSKSGKGYLAQIDKGTQAVSATFPIRGQIGSEGIVATPGGVLFASADELGTGTGLYALRAGKITLLAPLSTTVTLAAADDLVWLRGEGLLQARRMTDGSLMRNIDVTGFGWIAATGGRAFVSDRNRAMVIRYEQVGGSSSLETGSSGPPLGPIAVTANRVGVIRGASVILMTHDLKVVTTAILPEPPTVLIAAGADFIALSDGHLSRISPVGKVTSRLTPSKRGASVSLVSSTQILVCSLFGDCSAISLP